MFHKNNHTKITLLLVIITMLCWNPIFAQDDVITEEATVEATAKKAVLKNTKAKKAVAKEVAAKAEEEGLEGEPAGRKSNIVHVYAMSDFPAPVNHQIRLDREKAYYVHGDIHIGKNQIALNGASLQGFDPGKDKIKSSCKGAVILSRNSNVYLEKISIVCLDKATSAYDLRDDTNSFFCHLSKGCSVSESPGIFSAGVGKITGFNATTIDLNRWNVGKGLKISGKMNKFSMAYGYVGNIRKGSAVEFLSDAIVNDVVFNGNYFIYGGYNGIKISRGAIVKQGRMALNLFNGQSTYTEGFDSWTPGWDMINNSVGIPNSRAGASFYMNDNEVLTEFPSSGVYSKIEGETETLYLRKFDDIQENRLIYTGYKTITADIIVTVTGISSYDNADISIALMKNGKELIMPKSSSYNVDFSKGFQMRLDVGLDLEHEDYLEVYLKGDNNVKNKPILVKDMIVKVIERY